MTKTILFALALVSFLLTVHDAHAQGYYSPDEWRARRDHEICSRMSILDCQQYVLANVIGVRPSYGYGYDYDYYGRGGDVKGRDIAIIGAAVVGGIAIHKHIKNNNEKNQLADGCMLGDEQACRLLRLKDEKRYRKVMQARKELDN